MKKNLTLLITFLFATFLLNAQRVFKEKSNFEYNSLPFIKISEDKTYSRSGVITYEEDVIKEKEELAVATEEWNKKSAGDKLSEKIVGGGATADPTKFNYFPTIFSSDRLTGFININGLLIEDNAKAKVDVTVDRVNYYSEIKNHRNKNKDGVVTSSWQQIGLNAKIPVTVVVSVENGEAVSKQFTGSSFIEDGKKYTGKIKNKFLEAAKQNNFTPSENGALEDAFIQINNFLNYTYGYSIMKRATNIRMIKTGKKQNYDEINQAGYDAIEAYQYVIDPDMFETLKEKLTNSINIWETELKTLDRKKKKARINTVHGAALYLNIAEAYLWMNEFSKARQAIGKYKSMDVKRYDASFKTLNPLINEMRDRYEANNK
jgi:hypothetical protein